jgi:hypothetical protein
VIVRGFANRFTPRSAGKPFSGRRLPALRVLMGAAGLRRVM